MTTMSASYQFVQHVAKGRYPICPNEENPYRPILHSAGVDPAYAGFEAAAGVPMLLLVTVPGGILVEGLSFAVTKALSEELHQKIAVFFETRESSEDSRDE